MTAPLYPCVHCTQRVVRQTDDTWTHTLSGPEGWTCGCGNECWSEHAAGLPCVLCGATTWTRHEAAPKERDATEAQPPPRLPEIGSVVWSATVVDHLDRPVGGVVVEVFERITEDGEREPVYVCVDADGRGRIREWRIPESERAACDPTPADRRLVLLLAKLLRPIAEMSSGRAVAWTPQDDERFARAVNVWRCLKREAR